MVTINGISVMIIEENDTLHAIKLTKLGSRERIRKFINIFLLSVLWINNNVNACENATEKVST